MSLHDKFRGYFPLTLFLLVLAQIGCESPSKPLEAPLVPVTVAEVQEYSGAEGVNYSASIVPYQQFRCRSNPRDM